MTTVTTAQPTTLNVTFGRFNYPHISHKSLIKALGNDGVIIFSNGKKNIPVDQRVKMVKLLLETNTLRYTIKPDMFRAFSDAVEFAKSKGYVSLNIIVGEDRADTVREMAATLSHKNGFTVTTTTLDRARDASRSTVTSSTQMRKALDTDDKPADISLELWSEMRACRSVWRDA